VLEGIEREHFMPSLFARDCETAAAAGAGLGPRLDLIGRSSPARLSPDRARPAGARPA
jgi:hypothetical protein